jgi:nucleoside-diphosphate-sugar epimerase
LVNAYKNGEVKGLIARAADFYGPGVEKSAFTQTVYGNLLKDKNPQWLGKLDVIHNFTYSKDIGKALALLGNTEDAFNQVWHLPTTEEKLTSRQWIELMMNAMNKQKKISVLPVSAMGLVGFFVPIIKELKDVSYQLDRDYYFNSSKFNKRFNFTPTDPKEAMREIVMSAKR